MGLALGTINSTTTAEMATVRVSVLFNATEFGAVPWSHLRLTIERTTDPNADACLVMFKGQPVAPMKTDHRMFEFMPTEGEDTEVNLEC